MVMISIRPAMTSPTPCRGHPQISCSGPPRTSRFRSSLIQHWLKTGPLSKHRASSRPAKQLSTTGYGSRRDRLSRVPRVCWQRALLQQRYRRSLCGFDLGRRDGLLRRERSGTAQVYWDSPMRLGDNRPSILALGPGRLLIAHSSDHRLAPLPAMGRRSSMESAPTSSSPTLQLRGHRVHRNSRRSAR